MYCSKHFFWFSVVALACTAASWAVAPSAAAPSAAAASTASFTGITSAGVAVWESHHDGTNELNYGWPPDSNVIEGEHVELFTPRAYPMVYRKVRVYWLRSGAADELSFTVVFYANDNGNPGAFLGSVQTYATQVPTAAEGPKAYDVDVSALGVSLQEDGVFIGVLWDSATYPDFYIPADHSYTTVANTAYMRTGPLLAWQKTDTTYAGHRGYMFEAGSEEPNPVPLPYSALGVCMLALAVRRVRCG